MKTLAAGLALALSLIVFQTVPALGQQPVGIAPIDILIVDETDSFIESIAVNLIVGLLRQETVLFNKVDAMIANVGSPFDLPFQDNPSSLRYDLIIVAPKDALLLRQIWLVTPTYIERLPELTSALNFINELAESLSRQYEFEINLMDVSENLFVGILSGFFCRLGILSHP